MVLSCIDCEIQQVIGGKLQYFYIQPVFSIPAGVTPSEFRKDVDTRKTSMTGLLCGEEIVSTC